MIDAGMVLELSEEDRHNFVNFIKSIINCDGQLCSEMIYNMSTIDGIKIRQGRYQEYFKELRELFGVLDGKTI